MMFDRVFPPTQNLVKLISSENPKSVDLVKEVQLLKHSISANMVIRIQSQQRLKFMEQLWAVLLKVAESSEPAVYVSVRSAVGAILFSIFPFFPTMTIQSFSSVVQKMMKVSNASAVVIGAFLNLVNSMSPARIEAFLNHTPVLMHFKADVSNFIQHLPNLVHLMEPLEVSFHQNLLRSLMLSFGKNPNHYFIDSIAGLIAFEPAVLLKDFLEYVHTNNFTATILALGPKLLSNDKLFEMASDLKNECVDVALDVIANKESQLLDFEQACNTLAQVIQRTEGEELLALRNRINEKMCQNYPKHYLRFLLPLAETVEELAFYPEDSRSIMALKLLCLSKHLQKSPDHDHLKMVVKMILDVLKQEPDDVLTNAIILIGDCFDMLVAYDKEATAEMIKSLFTIQDLSWIQNQELLRCVLKIDCDLACELVPGFDQTVIQKGFSLCMSANEELSHLAISTMKRYVNTDNLNEALDKIMSMNLFDPSAALAFIRVVDALHSELQTSAFDRLADYVVEIIGLHEDDTQIAGAGFNLLTNLSHFNVKIEFLNLCIDWIVRLQKAATQCTSYISSPLSGKKELPLFLSYIDTDVIAVPICKVREESLKPLEACLKYFLSLTSTNDKRAVKFMEDFVCLFPDSILPRAIDYMSAIPSEFHRIVSTVANCTHCPKLAAACCEFLCFSPPEFRYAAVDTIRFLIQYPKVTSGAIVFSFYRFLHFSNVHDAGDLLEKAKKRLNNVEMATIDAKFCVTDDTKMSAFISSVPFSQWPVEDEDFCMTLEGRNERFTVTDFENFDLQHWKYMYDHIEMFDLAGLDEYSKRHLHSLKKFEPITEKVDKRPKFVFQDVPRDARHTILVQLLHNEYKFDKVLVKSFLQFTKYAIKQEQFNVIFEDVMKTKDPDLIRIAIEYSVRNGVSFNKKALLQTCLDVIKSSPSLMRVLAHHLGKDDIELPEELDIESLSFREFDWNSLVLSIDADRYVAKYFATMRITSSRLMQLSRVLTRFKFSGVEVIDFCVEHFQTIMKNEKRFVAGLRVLRVAITNVRKSPVLFGKLYPYLDSDITTVHIELGKILWPLFVDVEINSGIVEWLEKTNRTYAFFSPYLEALTVLYAYTDWQVRTFTASSISSLLNNEIASIRMNGLCAVESLVKGSATAWNMFTSISNDFFNVAKRVGGQPIFDAKIDSILRLIIKRQEFQASVALLVPKICSVLFVSLPNSPSFAGKMSILAMLIPLIPARFKPYEEYAKMVMQSPDKDPLSLTVVLDHIKWSIGWEPLDSRKAEMTIDCVNYAFKYVLQFNRDENIGAFMDSLWLPQCDFETAFTGIWKLSFLDFPMLKIVVMIHLFRKRCNDEQSEACKRMITFLYDSFDDKDRVKALELVFNGDPFGAASLSSS